MAPANLQDPPAERTTFRKSSSVKVRDPSIARALGPVAACVARCQSLGHLPQGRLHVAVSGGADSTLLFLLLHRLRRRLGLKLSVGHVDHQLREASAQEAKWVKKLAQDHEAPFCLDALSLAPGPDLAQRARLARRQALLAQADLQGAKVVAMGHTATDQVETMLMHATRGAGLAGLGAMDGWDPPILRPLMHLSRLEVIDLAHKLAPGFIRDPSNEDPQHPRVRVRQTLVPELRALNPRAEAAWGRLAQQAREADEALEAWAQREARGRDQGSGQVQVQDLDLMPMAVALRLIRNLCALEGFCTSELRHEVLRKICEAARYRAALAAGRVSQPAGGVGPVHFDLHPQGHLTVHRTKLSFFLAARR